MMTQPDAGAAVPQTFTVAFKRSCYSPWQRIEEEETITIEHFTARWRGNYADPLFVN
jgi:hypothetical protein